MRNGLLLLYVCPKKKPQKNERTFLLLLSKKYSVIIFFERRRASIYTHKSICNIPKPSGTFLKNFPPFQFYFISFFLGRVNFWIFGFSCSHMLRFFFSRSPAAQPSWKPAEEEKKLNNRFPFWGSNGIGIHPSKLR